MRPYATEDQCVIQWIAFASNAFNVLVPFYADVTETPAYMSNTTRRFRPTTSIGTAAMIAGHGRCFLWKVYFPYRKISGKVAAKGHELIGRYDAMIEKEQMRQNVVSCAMKQNQAIADMLQKETADTLDKGSL